MINSSQGPTWDQALVDRAVGLDRRKCARAILVVLLAVASAVGLLPGVADAEFEGPGTNGAKLDVNPSDDLAAAAVVQVTGKSFRADTLAQVFECGRSPSYLPYSCQAVGTARTDAVGGFNVSVGVSSVFVFRDDQRFTLPNVYDCAVGGCDVVASTDPD